MSEVQTGFSSKGSDRPPDFNYCPLSEARVVAQQIQNRSKLEKTHSLHVYADEDKIGSSSGCPDFNEDITCTYIDLDHLIAHCGISNVHTAILNEIMKGYSMEDIAAEMQISPQAVRAAFRRSVVKIVRKNDETWEDTNEIVG